MRKDERKAEAFELYGQGLPLIDISRKLDIPEGTIRCWKRRYNWDAALQQKNETVHNETLQKKRGGQPGNQNSVGKQNAVGNPGNTNASPPEKNTNAVKHGLFSKYFTPDTRDIYEQLLNGSPLDMLWHNIIFLQAEILRSQQIMFVKDSKDKTIEKIGFSDGDKGTSEQWEVQQAWDKQGSYLKALSRAQAELRNMIKDYLELEGQSKADAAANAKDWKQAIIEIAKRRSAKNE